MSSLTQPLHNFTRPVRMPLTFVFTRVTRESLIKVMLLLLGVMILLQLTASSLVRQFNGHRSQGLFWSWGQRDDSQDVHRILASSSSNQYSIMPGIIMDQDAISALNWNNSIFSVIKSSNAAYLANKTPRSDYSARSDHYSKQNVEESKSGNLNERQLSQKSSHLPKVTSSVIKNVYPRPRKHKNSQNKGRNILDLSTKLKQKFIDSNEVLFGDKIKTYKKNLTALLHEIKLPATTPEYDIVSPGSASAEERGTSEHPKGKPLCPAVPPDLEGPIHVTYAMPTMSRIESKFPDVAGGRWAPKNCTVRHRVAIIIPYRDREEHLRIFLNHIHPFLQKQLIDYGIYIVEQAGKSKFNRAMLMNIGFKEAGKLYDNQCYIFHDVDLLPEDDRNLYSCPSQPRHMSAGVDTMSYKLPYPTIFGGVVAFKKEHFQNVNGFSNCFFGWGGEDDDLYNRLKNKGYRLKRYPLRIARYRMISHLKEYPSPDRFTYLKTGSDRYNIEGLNSLTYKLVNISRHKLFTKFTVGIIEDEVMKNFQVTDMPPGLFDVDDPIDDDHANSWPDETTKEGNNKIKTQKFYTVVKQSDIQKIVEKLKKKAEDQKLMDRNLIQLPEAESNET